MRISDWSSDVCSSDLGPTAFPRRGEGGHAPGGCAAAAATGRAAARPGLAPAVCAATVGPAPAHRGAQVSRPCTIVAFKLQWPTSKSRSEEHTSELQSLMRISYAVFCLKKKKNTKH